MTGSSGVVGPNNPEQSLVAKLDFGDPLYLHASDTSGAPILNLKLNGTENYKVWSCAMTLALETKNKLGFVDGTCVRPADDPVLSKQWDRCNSVVLSWILSSVTEELFLGQVFSKNASQVWQDLKETYDEVDGSVTFNLHQKINSLSQNGGSVSDYYHKLNSLWKQFDALVKLPTCTCHASVEFTKHNQLLKLIQFLMGLDDIYLPIRSSILITDPLPSVKTAFSLVSREESHRGGSNTTTSVNKTQISAFLSKFSDNKKKYFRPNTLSCKHCGDGGYTIERCFKLIGFPKDFQNKSSNQNSKTVSNNVCASEDSSSNQSSQSSAGFSLSEEQVIKLLSLLDKNSSIEGASVNMAGIFPLSRSGWIIDSGANQHMTSSLSKLENIVDISDLHLQISHPNGTKVEVEKVGNIKLTANVTLFDVLYIPNFSVNLLSVHKLTRDSKLMVCFDETRCFIQDSHLKNVVETGSEKGGLYFFDVSSDKSVVANNVSISCCMSKQLWHSRLGHPADPVMSILKDKLKFVSENSSPCEVCHKAKQSRNKFDLSEHKTHDLGDLVHLDVWGPYKVSIVEGYRYFLNIVLMTLLDLCGSI